MEGTARSQIWGKSWSNHSGTCSLQIPVKIPRKLRFLLLWGQQTAISLLPWKRVSAKSQLFFQPCGLFSIPEVWRFAVYLVLRAEASWTQRDVKYQKALSRNIWELESNYVFLWSAMSRLLLTVLHVLLHMSIENKWQIEEKFSFRFRCLNIGACNIYSTL